MPSGEAGEEAELLLEEVAISETTSLESALENLKIQVPPAFHIACCHQSASATAKLSCEFSRIGNIRQSGQLNTCVTCPPPCPLCPGTLAPSVTLQLGGIFTRLRMFGLAPPSHSPIRLLSKQRGNAESYQSCGNCLETEFVANESRIPVGLVDDNQTRGMQCMCSMAGGM